MPAKLTQGQYFGHIIRCQDYDFFRCTLTEYFPQTVIERHYHENNYLSLLVKGKYVEKEKSDNSLLEQGNIIFRPALYSHSNIFTDKGGTCFNIEFKKNWEDAIEYDFRLPDKKNIYQPWGVHIINRLFYTFINDTKNDLIVELMMNWLIDVNKEKPVCSSLPWLEKVKNILENESDTHHTIHSISARVYLHPVYLAGAFRRKTGFTIGEWQRKIKLQKSTSLLLNTQFTIDKIAFSTGYNDSSHFIKAFKDAYQLSPLKFRKAIKS